MKKDFEKILKQHKYCFICKGNLIIKGFNFLQCDNCGYRNFINPAPTSGAILENDNGEILLVRRRVDPGKGLWDSPGGFIDLGESAEEGMIRELKEELNVDITDIKYFGSYPDYYTFDGIEILALGITYTGKIGNQKITPTDDIDGYEFFKKNELPFDKIAFEGLKKILADYVSSEL